ncbi:uncharacterized protein L969DRAFT_607201 [Mixia osmundae IAM 14324]|uniref:ATP-dependent RNA helicase DOB1 n=1 Tax=Mixia osmundae (strain CBS 9802 / IAM 14324 / JCM 22182 / KY 12970) TaxID=764103 RepID=G7E307_MIXOS|nr:uncharacterized protein L969DRAFT_607201 [Mixia osmundae IAM 14324]KEI42523.1 hypothetical protein L969DRAFT_607201 [Mixia osmundae IAM 14324]GAA97188.1 hypothetical protein E5Q_03864 [Mixia osmundae IAM 14324]
MVGRPLFTLTGSENVRTRPSSPAFVEARIGLLSPNASPNLGSNGGWSTLPAREDDRPRPHRRSTSSNANAHYRFLSGSQLEDSPVKSRPSTPLSYYVPQTKSRWQFHLPRRRRLILIATLSSLLITLFVLLVFRDFVTFLRFKTINHLYDERWITSCRLRKAPALFTVGPDEASLVWETNCDMDKRRSETMKLRWATVHSDGTRAAWLESVQHAAVKRTILDETHFVYSARLLELTPGSFAYEIYSEGSSKSPRIWARHSFAWLTADALVPLPTKLPPILIAAVGDNQFNVKVFTRIMRKIGTLANRHWPITMPTLPTTNAMPQLLLHVGDAVQEIDNLQQWQTDFYDALNHHHRLSSQVPMIYARGNHDFDDTLAYTYSGGLPTLTLADGIQTSARLGTWQAFSLGRTRWIILDSNFDQGANDEQERWIRDEVKRDAWTKASFRIVVVHIPPFLEYWDQHAWTELDERDWGEHVRHRLMPHFQGPTVAHPASLVISGHSHAYARGTLSDDRASSMFALSYSNATRSHDATQQHGTTYTIIGGAGGTLDEDRVEDWHFFDSSIAGQHHFVSLALEHGTEEALPKHAHSVASVQLPSTCSHTQKDADLFDRLHWTAWDLSGRPIDSFVMSAPLCHFQMDDLFDVFDESQPVQNQPAVANAPPSRKRAKQDKPKTVAAPVNVVELSSSSESGEEAPVAGPSSVKSSSKATNGSAKTKAVPHALAGSSKHNKRSRREEEPVSGKVIATDSFQTESTREVAPSAGLAGAPPTAAEPAVSLTHQVRHQVAIPPDYPYTPISSHVQSKEPARTYPFVLDPFQQVSINSIERNESVLVSAHTSAGKTVVAEYAIAQCLRDKQRVIYTSPIKALSNQKYREMAAEFGDVGLMTGDVTINPTASCLVMTTEILRSMLYRGSEVMREVAWVIFDEIHYMRDKERGVVWEETIILLPHKVHYVFLSATIPNAFQFAEWICKIHEQPCHVVYTEFRPTPLQHYLFPAGGEGIHLVVDERGAFREDNFQKAMSSLNKGQGDDPSSPFARGKQGKTRKPQQKGLSDIYKIIKMIMTKNYHPVIVFAFSKRECESLALQMSKLEFNTEDEKAMVADVFNNAIAALSDDDRTLPQIEHILPLLKRGIGIHHGGLLPILKEVIEILFQEGLIKVLFATETFSIGLNMPAKTVVFTAVRKWDGTDTRDLSGGEYIQMSGRAGRRGKDDRGIVILMCDDKMEPSSAKSMVKGVADRLDSAFHLGYNMILNLMRVEGISPEYMLERCFFQFQSTGSVPQYEAELRQAEDEFDAIAIDREADVAEYYDMRQQLMLLNKDLHDVVTHPSYALPFMQPGRVVKVQHNNLDFGWACVVDFTKRRGEKGRELNVPAQEEFVVTVLLCCATGASEAVPPSNGDKGRFELHLVLLSTIQQISMIRLKLPTTLKSPDQRQVALQSLREVERRFPDGFGLLDPVKNMGITDPNFQALVERIAMLESKAAKCSIVDSPQLQQLYGQYEAKQAIQQRIRAAKKKVSDAHSVLHLDELKNRKRVLRRLGFANAEDVVEMKGRVACEISTGDELLLTEMIFHGVFNELTPEQSAALLSCFVFDEKSNDSTNKLRTELAGPLRVMQETAKRIAQVCKESHMVIDEEAYVASFKPELIDATYQWVKGAKFSDVSKQTDVFEGSLIRVFRRLGELIRQMASAAKAIGNTELETKFVDALKLLERPQSVVFNPSLYL